jgi:hypothetical protein
VKVFLSWSGSRSRAVALALREWLPVILQSVEPWMSETDIPAGSRWNSEVGRQLQHAGFGIICLTSDNAAAPWILFEAGALAQSFEEGAVCPYLLDLPYKDLNGPLTQFQGKRADAQGTYEVLAAINERADVRLPPDRLEKIFRQIWPEIDRAFSRIPASAELPRASRPEPEVLEELVTIVRRMERRLEGAERAGMEPIVKPDMNALFKAAMYVDVRTVQQHVAAVASQTPLPELAGQIGISESSLDAFISTVRRTDPTVLHKLREWFATQMLEGRLLNPYWTEAAPSESL